MKLDHSTYEAWLLDRIEGVLTSAQVRELDAFLGANPNLPAANGELPHVDDGEEGFPMKVALHRNFPPTGVPGSTRLNDFLAARLEDDLSAEQEKQLDRYLYEHPEAARDAALMARTKLAQEEITFDEKASIERHFPPRGLPGKHRLIDFLIAEMEGDLEVEQCTALKQYGSEHAETKREQQLVAAAFVDRIALVFAEKDALKKRAVRVVPLWPGLAAAASIALLLSLGWWLLHDERTLGNDAVAEVGQAMTQETVEHQSTAQKAPAVQVQTTIPEAPRSQDGGPARDMKRGATIVQDREHSPTEQTSAEESRRMDQPFPTVEPINRITRAAIPDQVLAQVAIEESDGGVKQATATAPASSTAFSSDRSGEALSTFLANKMRSDVLDAPRRVAGLDGTDAMAMADKAIGKITGGQGGVDVQHSATRDRIHVRLGRNFSLSASRGH